MNKFKIGDIIVPKHQHSYNNNDSLHRFKIVDITDKKIYKNSITYGYYNVLDYANLQRHLNLHLTDELYCLDIKTNRKEKLKNIFNGKSF